MQYSFKKGVTKGIVSGLTVLAAMIAFAGFSDITIWGLLETYIKPILGTMTVGGSITMVINYIKIKKQK